jgi:hypothetical protein
MNKERIKRAILQATGNPESGVIRDNLNTMAEAVLKVYMAEETKNYAPAKETRVREIKETR